MERNFNPNKIVLKDFKIVKGEIKAEYDFDKDFIDSYKTDLSFNASVDVPNKLVKAEMGFSIETNSTEQQDEAIAKFDLVYLYEVENLNEIIIDDSNPVQSKDELDLMIAISAISFSTSRGVLMTRLQGTVMKDYILPIIDPKGLNKGVKDNLK